ncbi:ABC transporter substrate-binding protein [Streptomyces cavernicola]|uniref:ABC transporter substrate-binding protein n=1 Tax=Streptomyces cavernicola TaxID=3043613 RepID=A0ABT6S9K5_9ACTN|nr:ABC transporter substrate-binding protein [Streptomyces sp. B-S-A6]MDI3404815.1 ABC transporter substrate-binding protein [Streptomyces sp. B-S-A6]
MSQQTKHTTARHSTAHAAGASESSSGTRAGRDGRRRRLRGALRRLAAAPVALLLLATGCGGSGSGSGAAGGDGPEKSTVTVAATPLVDSAALYIAQERGYFKDEGLRVRVRVRPVQQSVQAVPALANGQVDVVAGGNYVTMLQAQERGALKLRILVDGVALARHSMDVVVMPDSPIRTAKDLQGRKVAENVLHSIQSLRLDAILKAEGKSAKPVEYRQVPFPQMAAALEKGQVEAADITEPFLTDARRRLNARVVVDGASGPASGLPLSGYAATQQFTEENPRTAAAFQRAVRRAQRDAAQNRDTWRRCCRGTRSST